MLRFQSPTGSSAFTGRAWCGASDGAWRCSCASTTRRRCVSTSSVPVRRGRRPGSELASVASYESMVTQQQSVASAYGYMNESACAPDGVVRAEANPLRDGPVLLLLLAQNALDLEGLVGRLQKCENGDSRSARQGRDDSRHGVASRPFSLCLPPAAHETTDALACGSASNLGASDAASHS